MSTRVPALAAFTLTSTEGRITHPQNIAAAIHSSRLVQALCWFLVVIL